MLKRNPGRYKEWIEISRFAKPCALLKETYEHTEEAFDDYWNPRKKDHSIKAIIDRLSAKENSLTQYLVSIFKYNFFNQPY